MLASLIDLVECYYWKEFHWVQKRRAKQRIIPLLKSLVVLDMISALTFCPSGKRGWKQSKVKRFLCKLGDLSEMSEATNKLSTVRSHL